MRLVAGYNKMALIRSRNLLRIKVLQSKNNNYPWMAGVGTEGDHAAAATRSARRRSGQGTARAVIRTGIVFNLNLTFDTGFVIMA